MKQLAIIAAILLYYLFSTGFLFINGSEYTSYHGYKVYQVTPETYEQAEIIRAFYDDPKFDVWKESRTLGDPTDIMVAPKDQWNFERELIKNNLKYNVVIDNVERLIQQERTERSMSRSFLRMGGVTFSSYMFYEEQMAYLRRLATDHPNIINVTKIGESYEGRDLLLLRLSSGASQTTIPKPIIFIDAGIHCREWISPPVALYIIQQLIENSTNTALYENVDWAILPNLNPDGYEYTQTDNRLWRKNRRLTEGAVCYGTDLNRNFGYQWMFDGASNESCSEIFAGPQEFSEPESRALRDWFAVDGANVKLYLTFHSFGEMILYPWGYQAVVPEDSEDLQYLGELAATAIESASTINSAYIVNTSAIALYAAAGGSDDWVKAVAGVNLSYTIELPNGDAPYSFMLPARQILPVVQETWEGVKVFHSFIEERFWTNLSQPQAPTSFLRNIQT